MVYKMNNIKNIGSLEVYNTSIIRAVYDRFIFSVINVIGKIRAVIKKPLFIHINGVYMNYEHYKRNIDFYDKFTFQQKTRKENIKNLNGF